MEFIHIHRDDIAFGVIPRSVADPVSGILIIRTEIGPPGLAGDSCGFGKLPAVGIGTRQPAEICSIAGALAGDEKTHGRILSQSGSCTDHHRSKRHADCGFGHCDFPLPSPKTPEQYFKYGRNHQIFRPGADSAAKQGKPDTAPAMACPNSFHRRRGSKRLDRSRFPVSQVTWKQVSICSG